MISGIKLKSGPVAGAPGLSIATTPVTVFVGPNNSGKSRILIEIEQLCSQFPPPQSGFLVLDSLSFKSLSLAETESAISKILRKPNPGETLPEDQIFVGGRRGRWQVRLDQLKHALQDPTNSYQIFSQMYLQHRLLRLDGPGRIGLVQQQTSGDLQIPQNGTFGVLFTDDAKRTEVRRIIYEAFDLYFVIDPTWLGQFRIRLSDRAPTDMSEERGIDARSITFHGRAIQIEQTSDGIKAFTGIITEVIAGDPEILLIDEPEAFLHPSLAFKLGLEIAAAASKTDKRVLASTHSPSFLMGCIQSGAPTNIVRLTYRAGVATARMLPSSEILSLIRNPLLRSANVLQGLFYEFVVVTEADTDRAFYQEINERLLRYKQEWGIPNCLFLHAQNKQTIHTIVRPLRKLGIPVAAIVDIDALKNSGSDWGNLIDSANVPELERTSFSTLRASVKVAMDATGKDMKRDGGIEILTGTEFEAAKNLLARLAEYGVFVIPFGEVEYWLRPLGASGHGPSWLIQLFEKMGEDPDVPEYIRPSGTDVWRFMSEIRAWLVSPNRKGIPSL